MNLVLTTAFESWFKESIISQILVRPLCVPKVETLIEKLMVDDIPKLHFLRCCVPLCPTSAPSCNTRFRMCL